MYNLSRSGCTYRNHAVTHAEVFHWAKDDMRIHRAQRTYKTSASVHATRALNTIAKQVLILLLILPKLS